MLHKNSKERNEKRIFESLILKKQTRFIMRDIWRKQSYCIYWFRISWIIEDRYNFWYQSAYFHLVLITFVEEAARAIFLTSCCYVFSNIDEHAITPIVCLIITSLSQWNGIIKDWICYFFRSLLILRQNEIPFSLFIPLLL